MSKPQVLKGAKARKKRFDGSFMDSPVYLGEAMADAAQRLTILGGKGVSASTDGSAAMLPGGDRLIAFHGDADGSALRRVLRTGPAAVACDLPGMAEAIGPVDLALAAKPTLCAANSVARSAAGEGWLAAGDSAMALDPLSSQGLFNALATGLEAGEATLALVAGDEDATQRYAARISRIWQAYVGHHATYYGMETRWPAAPFWARRLGSA